MVCISVVSLETPVNIQIMYICNQWFVSKNWHFQSISESLHFKVDDKPTGIKFIKQLICNTYDFEPLSDEISIELLKEDQSIMENFIDNDNIDIIDDYLEYIKIIDRDKLDNLYRSQLVLNTNNDLTSKLPTEMIEHILKFI